MLKTKLYNIQAVEIGEVELNESVFGVEYNEALIHQVVVAQLANKRQGTKSTLTRAEVRGGGIKPWRQKGTGRARQGSIRAAQWYHGGIVFGPHMRSYDKKMNRKERRLALKSALAYKVIDKELVIVDSLNVETSKTKDFKNLLNNFKVERNVLIVVSELNDNLVLATRNLNNVLLLEASEINVLDIVSANLIIAEESAIKEIEEALV
jgi:large subunit ribosomal protein L4